MTTYKYRGLSPDGAKVSGVIKAYNEYEAVAQLRQTCSVITKIEEVKETKSLNPDLGKKRIKDKELAIICSQFAIILTSGLPIVKCVEMVAAQAQNKDLRAMLYKVAEDVAGGYSLARALKTTAPASRRPLSRRSGPVNRPVHWKFALTDCTNTMTKLPKQKPRSFLP